MNVLKRQQQIDYGKNTLGYVEYLKEVPKSRRTRRHPKTPDIHVHVSKRAFNGVVRRWRQALHEYDPYPRKDIHERQDLTVYTNNSSHYGEKLSFEANNCCCHEGSLSGGEIKLAGKKVFSLKKGHTVGIENWEESLMFFHRII